MITKLLTYFNEQEEYEKSQIVTEIYNGWLNYNLDKDNTKVSTKTKRKRGRPRKNNTDSSIDKNKK